ncbi:poly-beta-1,6-N-acetyl-D-glucosamine synthase [Kangiella koreensis]|uniref:Poly-beta-1,6-N-acetyl-D-glucosamine synthase n=1 Tax=Kangiella koreensis (strain DSM 16069 / JCM 12317 / KCTC 12182 / SW-125) TaxID=523791 RepID=C7RBF1_KANKD|nr:poly-beta-1,6-N-acetyl-D-glucosamine synthase [Kangiella koreensis]ACV26593.1 glycosyl transferase family 2 [Kangiella koreensis DSM 16069]
MNNFMEFLFSFAFYYPLFMAYVWMIGAIYYRFHWEHAGGRSYSEPPELKSYPGVSVLLPCFNEGELARETIERLFQQTYPNFEVIAVNDGSTDNTREVLDELSEEFENLRVVHLESNQGKAMAMNMAAMLSKHEYLVGIDGDAILEEHAVHWLVSHFINDGGTRVGAVTGNPRVRNRTTLLGKIQVGEFSSIIGLIKRAQRIYGRIFTVSGVVSAFRKSAMHRIGYWTTDMITEDIDVSWRLQLNHWEVRYEPNALCWILMPETFAGLWKQRLRWAQGGMEVFKRYFKQLFKWRSRRMWIVAAEYIISAVWSYVAAGIIVLWTLGLVINIPEPFHIGTIIPGWNGVMLAMTCLLQFAVSLVIDSSYDKGLGRYYYWMIWYPLAYWLINVITVIVGVPKALLRQEGIRATWKSPDRGI